MVGANVAGAAVGLAQPVLPGDMIGKIISGQIAAHTAAVVKDKWFGGGRVDHAQVAYDAFGNALAQYWMDSFKAVAPESAPVQATAFGRPRDFLASLDPRGPETMATEPSLMDRTRAGMLTPLVSEPALADAASSGDHAAAGADTANGGGVHIEIHQSLGGASDLPQADSANPGRSVLEVANAAATELEPVYVYARAIDNDLPHSAFSKLPGIKSTLLTDQQALARVRFSTQQATSLVAAKLRSVA